MTCGTCKHWTRPEEREDFRYGPLSVPYRLDETDEDEERRQRERNGDYGRCAGIVFSETVADDAPAPIAVCLDGSGYQALVMTKAEFSCALWAPQPPSA